MQITTNSPYVLPTGSSNPTNRIQLLQTKIQNTWNLAAPYFNHSTPRVTLHQPQSSTRREERIQMLKEQKQRIIDQVNHRWPSRSNETQNNAESDELYAETSFIFSGSRENEFSCPTILVTPPTQSNSHH